MIERENLRNWRVGKSRFGQYGGVVIIGELASNGRPDPIDKTSCLYNSSFEDYRRGAEE